MKRILPHLLYFFILQSFAQTPSANRNSVIEKMPRIGMTSLSSNYTDVQTSIQYIDGRGRPIQKNHYRASPNGSQDNITENTEYDNYDRPTKSYLPTPYNYSGQYLSNVQSPAQTFYDSESKPYSENVYENSPLNRVIKTYGVGNAWRVADKSVQTNFGTSGGIRRYEINYATNPRTIDINGTYPANSLFKTIVTNERDKQVIEYKDSEGKLIQQDIQDDTGYITTAYVYDNFGRLAYTIQPKAYNTNIGFDENSIAFKEGTFANKFDKRGRIIEKHTPSIGWTYFVYNSLDQVVLSQNARQRQETNKKWDFKKYDATGREILLGTLTDNRGRASLQALADNDIYETKGTTLLGYTNTQFPVLNEADVKLVNYYDEYGSWLPSDLFFHIDSAYHAQYSNVRGLATGAKYRSTETEQWLVSVIYYGIKNRIIQQFEQNHLNGITRKDFKYNFVGDIVEDRSYTRSSIDTLFRKTEYVFDHTRRPTKVFFTSNAKRVEMANYNYDSTGRVIMKKVQPNRQYQVVFDPDFIYRPPSPANNTQDIARRAIFLQSGTVIQGSNANKYLAYINQSQDGITDALQTFNYAYDIRGNLKCVNCLATGIQKLDSTQNDLFSMKWNFHEDGRFYDGNISNLAWVSKINKYQPRKYVYDYNAANALKSAIYTRTGTNENYSLPLIEYDKNGNITKLVRYGATQVNNTGQALNYGRIDSLKYEYPNNVSNRVSVISDFITNNPNVEDFRDSTNIQDYDYYDDGSLKVDKNKRINNFSYNYLGLTEEITLTNNRWVRNFYDGTGKKIKKITSEGAITHYIGDIIYIGTATSLKLYQFQHPEGRATPHPTKAKTFLLEYQYADHLGNLRLAFRDSTADPVGGIYRPPVVTQESHTDPFGLTLKQLSFTIQSNQDKHTFGEHERQDEFGLGLFDMQTRLYDPTRGQFAGTDLSADNYPSFSPFVYAGNNPVAISDPDGRDWYLPLMGNGLLGMPIWFDQTGNKEGFLHLGDANYLFTGGWLNEVVIKPEGYKDTFTESLKFQTKQFQQQLFWYEFNRDFSIQDKQSHVRQTVFEPFKIREQIVHKGTGIIISENSRWSGGAAPDFGTSLMAADLTVLTVKGIGSVAGKVMARESAEMGSETFYRTMNNEAAESFLKTGKMPAGTETFVSPTKSFAQNYSGTLFEINLRPGTVSQLQNIGVRNAAMGHPLGHLPLVQSGWKGMNAFFKLEKTALNPNHINIGLGNGRALNIFNSNIQNFRKIP